MEQNIPMPQAKLDVDADETLSSTLIELINTFPAMTGQKVFFSTLGQTSGLGFFPLSGSAVLKEEKDITGMCYQSCQYPFLLIYRAAPKSEAARLRIKEFLDLIGKWLERQMITADNWNFQLEKYPKLDCNREIKSIQRSSPAYLDKVYDDGIEDWSIAITATYQNTFMIMR